MIYAIFYGIMVLITLFSMLVWAHYDNENPSDNAGLILAASIGWPATIIVATLVFTSIKLNGFAETIAERIKKNRKK